MKIEARLYNQLQTSQFNPYWSGQHQGKCKENYCVLVGPNFSAMNKTGGSGTIDVILFSPRTELQPGRYISISDTVAYRDMIKLSLKELGLKLVHETPIIVDTEVMAYTTSLTYQIYRRG